MLMTLMPRGIEGAPVPLARLRLPVLTSGPDGADPVAILFGADWSGQHRPLPGQWRDLAGKYIEDLVAHASDAADLDAITLEAWATHLWRCFRERYDGLRPERRDFTSTDLRAALAIL
jgi:hypothetical protein